MFRLARSLLLLSLFPVAAAVGAADEKMAETPYYPLAIGTTWHYKSNDGVKCVMKVVAHEKVGQALCARVEMVVEGSKKEPITEHLSVTAEGVYRNSMGSATPDKPVRILKLPLKAGEEWRIESKALGDTIKGTFTVGAEKEITVPAGKFKAFPVSSEDLDANGVKFNCTSYYAANVGMISQKIQIGMQITNLELEKFEAAKK